MCTYVSVYICVCVCDISWCFCFSGECRLVQTLSHLEQDFFKIVNGSQNFSFRITCSLLFPPRKLCPRIPKTCFFSSFSKLCSHRQLFIQSHAVIDKAEIQSGILWLQTLCCLHFPAWCSHLPPSPKAEANTQWNTLSQVLCATCSYIIITDTLWDGYPLGPVQHREA